MIPDEVSTKLESTFRLANQISYALRCPTHVVLAHVLDGKYLSYGGWAGGHPHGQSFAPYPAGINLAELIAAGPLSGFEITPIPEMEIPGSKRGAIRVDEHIISVAHMNENHCLMLAFVLLCSLKQQVLLHHVGIRYTNEALMQNAISRASGPPICVTQGDMVSTYYRVDYPDSDMGYHYFQPTFMSATNVPAGAQEMHLDLVVRDNVQFVKLLNRLKRLASMDVVYFSPTNFDDGVFAFVRVEDPKEHFAISFMFRDRWWDIES